MDTSTSPTSKTPKTDKNQDLDELKFKSDSALKKALDPDETVVLSTLLYKYNRKLKRQERSLLITTQAIYNVNQQDFLTNFISVFNSSFKIRRKIDITKLAGVTVSSMSSEFVIHIKGEYDYRYSSPGGRDKILLALARVHKVNAPNRPLPFFFKDVLNLNNFTTSKEDQKLQVSKMPTDSPSVFDEATLKSKLDEITQRAQSLKAVTQTVYTKNEEPQKIGLDDFDMIKVLGRGAFGKVMLVEKKDTKQLYAMKSIHKEQIISQDQIDHTKTERYLLEKNKSPFLVGLEFAFQTPEKIFFIMKFMRGGELFHHLRAAKRFDERRAKFYAAEILLALEYLQSLGVAYRDLKPENILLDEEGHICLTDFGMAKPLMDGATTKSFVGTPEYLAPEVIQGKGHGKPVDWWTLGILIYEMIIGSPPFYAKDQAPQEMFNSILKKEVDFGFKVKLSQEAKDLILKLLVKDPSKRLGVLGTSDIKTHPWFAEIDWKMLAQKKIVPPFKPKLTNDYDVDNFDEEFTSEEAMNSVAQNTDMKLVKKYQNEFKDFTYQASNDLLTK